MDSDCNRRDFLKLGAAAGTGLTLAAAGFSGCENMLKGRMTQPFEQFSVPPIETVRVGYVGLGGMGSNHIRNLLDIEGVEIRAVCDIVEEKVAETQKRVQEAGFNKPAGYSRGETDFKRMCEKEDLDLVYNATPWEWHVPICVAAMESGKHAATEVPAAVTIDECWQLVETAEKTRRHCLMMENACYGRTEMAVLNMVRQGVLGELLHGEAGYMHDLRNLKLSSRGEGLWRGDHSVRRNGNLYPTHGLGPLSQCMNINRAFDMVREIYLNLTMADRRRFDERYTSVFFTHAATQPTVNAEKLLALMRAGIVEVVSLGKKYRLIKNEAECGFDFIYRNRQGKPKKDTYQYVVNARGQEKSLETDPSALAGNLLQSGTVQLKEVSPAGQAPGAGHGVASASADGTGSYNTGSIWIDPGTHRIMHMGPDGNHTTSNAIYAVGAMTRGQIINASMVRGIVQAASRVADDLINYLG